MQRTYVASKLLAFSASLFAITFASSTVEAQISGGSAGNTQVAVPKPSAQPPATLAEIVVTAQRREENLQRTALPVSAVSGSDLQKAGVTEVGALTRLIPALVVQPSVGTATNFYIRGVGSFAANPFTDNPIAFSFNGVFINRPFSPIGTFFDLKRVEVLKGPQGTLYGRNATGGAINVIPESPKLGHFSFDGGAEYGNYDSKKVFGAVNIPLSDVAALRVAGQVVDRQAYLSDGYDDEKGQAVRASVLYEPSPKFRVTLVADYFHQGGKGAGSVLVPGPVSPNAPPPDERIGAADPRSVAALIAASPGLVGTGLVQAPKENGYVDGDFWGVAATVVADLGFASLTVLPAYRDSHPKFLAYNGGYQYFVDERALQSSIETRLASNGHGRLGYVAGLYLVDERQRDYVDATHGPILESTFLPHLTDQSAAVFGEARYSLIEPLRLVLGARYTSERKTQKTQFTQTSFGSGPTSDYGGSATFNELTYKAGLEWDVAPHSLLYGNIATGFKSGGFFIAPLDNTFQPEKLTAYTVGSKNRFLENRLQVNAEVFYWDYRDQQVNFIGPIRTSATSVGQGLRTSNAGRSRIYGAEVEVQFQASGHDVLAADLQYLNGKYTQFSYTVIAANGAPPRTNCALGPAVSPIPAPARAFSVDCSGRPQLNSPEWTLNASYEHTWDLAHDLRLTGGVRTRLESGRYLSLEYLPEEYQKADTTSDVYMTLGKVNGGWAVTAFVNNLEDRTIYAGSLLRPIVPVVYNNLRPPRTYGVRVNFRL